MTLTMLDCFVAAMETMNFTTAAANMHMTQPAFSRNIAALESDLGFPLFIRSKQKGLSATPAGEEMYQGISKLGMEFEQLLKSARRISRGEQGKLTIGLISGKLVDSLTMEAVRLFRERYPLVDVQLTCLPMKSLVDAVASQKIDTCIILTNVVRERSELCHEELMQIENYLAVPARLNCEQDAVYSLYDFRDEIFLLSEDAPELNQFVLRDCRAAGFEPKTKMAPDYETKMLWSEFGEGLAINSSEHYSRNSPCVNFVRVKELLNDTLSIIWQKNNTNPTVPQYVSIVRELVQNLK